MRSKILSKMATVNCCLLLLPTIAFAAGSGETATKEAAKEAPKTQVEEVFTMDDVVVNAVRLEKYLLTTSVITDKDIEAKGAKNLAEALEDVPGLNIHRGKKNNVTVDIRGVTSTDTKIIVDGIVINPLSKMTNTSAIDISMIPTDNIAKIEIIKGPSPVIYGTDAKGGVILITTKDGKTSPGGTLALSTGSWNTVNGSVSYGGGDSKFNYYFNAGAEHTDGYLGDKRDEKHINAKMTWKLAKDSSLTFNGNYSLTNKGCLDATDPIDGHIVSSKNGFWPGLNKWEFRDWEKTNLSLTYAQKLNEKFDYNLKIYRSTESQELWGNGANYDASTGLKVKNGVVNGSSSDMGYSINRWNASRWESSLNGIELQNNWKLSSKNLLTFGFMFNDIDWKNSASINPINDPYNPNSYKWLNYNNKRYGYYLQDNITPNDKTTITLGVRYDRNEVTGSDSTSTSDSATSPTLNFLYQLDNKNTMRASVGKTCTFPSVEQLFGVKKNPAGLSPEKATNYELGFKHIFDETLTGDIAFFQNDINDKIDVDPVQKIYYNISSAQIKGFEIELKKKFSKKLSGFLNYTYLDTKATAADGSETDLSYTPENHLNYGLEYKPGKGYTINLSGHWVSQRYTGDTGSTSDTRTKVNGQAPVYSYLGSYALVDLKISRRINDRQEWYVMVNNIFDKQYEDELFYNAPGRNIAAGVNYKF